MKAQDSFDPRSGVDSFSGKTGIDSRAVACQRMRLGIFVPGCRNDATVSEAANLGYVREIQERCSG